ncbi:penicillin-binding protein [Alkalibacterium subtropicum]|uniref:Beta-lactamase n=1 Tax=Alkalibacterium subtropicum TaxID=753702 RepID=A0A1I1HN11_9LACT|nr:penicillin-binding transpeptidase domain-containing protein [Alkalibacterium subtropicum]SFC25241.1 penicillin-binding protein [Alkalibacterium subtropicum]
MKNSRKQWKASNRKVFGIAAGIAVFILISISGYFYYRNWQEEQLALERREEIEGLVDEYLDAKASTRFKEYVDTLSEGLVSAEGYTRQELAERYETVFQAIGVDTLDITDREILYDEEADTYAFRYTTLMTTVLGETEMMAYQAEISETEEAKAVQWDHSLFLPNMEEGDTVSLSYTEPMRGSIYDRDGNMLAGEGKAYDAGLYPAVLGEGDQREERLAEISETFDVSVPTLERLLSQNWVTEESLVPFKVVDVGETPEVPGVLYQQTTDRLYPLGEAAAHLTGYVGDVSAEDIENDPKLQSGQVIGKGGLEYRFDQELRGDMGGQIALVDSEGEVKEVIVEREKQDGESLTLTISSAVQSELFAAFDSEPGSASLMDPESGELLALVSSPSYDPQLFARGISLEEFNAYNQDEDQPFLNRFTARYAPGSTFKILSSLVLLESGTTTPDKVNTIEGLSWSPETAAFGDREITRVNDSVTEVDLKDALVYSDNIFFAMEAFEMGTEDFVEGLSQFPFGESFELPLTMNPAQLANNDRIDEITLLADTAYGQGEILMNTIHQQVFYSPILNEGTLVYPKLLKEAEGDSAEGIVSAENAELVRELLLEAVTDPNGTSHALDQLDYAVGAKTGTAEIGGEEENETNGFLYVFDEEKMSYSFVGSLEGQKSGDVIDRFVPFFSSVPGLLE